MTKKIVDMYHGDTISTYDEICSNTYCILHKSTQGLNYTDPKAKERLTAFEKRKHPYWLYIFLNNGNELEQVKYSIKQFEEFLSDKKYFVGWAMDIEDKNNVNSCITAYKWLLNYCKEHKHKLLLYWSKSSLEEFNYQKLYDLSVKDKEIVGYWEATYHTEPSIFTDLWQYTGEGACKGMVNRGDINKVICRPVEWFTTRLNTESEKKGYAGIFPVLPDESFGVSRTWYQLGDGYITLKNYPTQINRVVSLLNWYLGTNVDTKGKYNEDAVNLCKKAQKKLKLPVNGKFGSKTLPLLKKVKK